MLYLYNNILCLFLIAVLEYCYWVVYGFYQVFDF